MIARKTVHPNLVRAYREAIYIVNEGDDAIALKVGEVSHALAALMRVHKAQTAAIITAYNPFSEIQSPAENERQQKTLVAALKPKSTACFDAIGSDPEGKWEPEASTLALGISLVDAERLADQFGQNAFIWINTIDAFVSLRLRFEIGIPNSEEVQAWIQTLPEPLQGNAQARTIKEQALLMSVASQEQLHWLNPNGWDLNQVWPLSCPDGSAMGIGTEMDRMFKLIAAGIQKVY
jgi:hypothetical protein